MLKLSSIFGISSAKAPAKDAIKIFWKGNKKDPRKTVIINPQKAPSNVFELNGNFNFPKYFPTNVDIESYTESTKIDILAISPGSR